MTCKKCRRSILNKVDVNTLVLIQILSKENSHNWFQENKIPNIKIKIKTKLEKKKFLKQTKKIKKLENNPLTNK